MRGQTSSEVRSTMDDPCADSLLPKQEVALSRGKTSEETLVQDVESRTGRRIAVESRKQRKSNTGHNSSLLRLGLCMVCAE